MTFADAFLRDLPHGTCAGVRLPSRDTPLTEDDLAPLHDDERAHVAALPPLRRVSWVGGRLALRRALSVVAPHSEGILVTPRGAPRLPASVRGSISHKDTLAVALAAPARESFLGIDLEIDAPRKTDISRHVLTEEERDRVALLPDDERLRIVTLHFSIKEAIYKAIDPFVGRYVGFHEVRVEPRPDGDVAVVMGLNKNEGPFDVEAWWERKNGNFLATARATFRGQIG